MNIPVELKQQPRWVLWREEMVGDRRTKVPYWYNGGLHRASSTNAATWTTYERAVELAKPHQMNIGFCLGDGIAGVDFDGCRDPETGTIDDWALAELCKLNSYTEVSPSGTGVKVFLRAKLPGPGAKAQSDHPGHGGKQRAIEIYDSGRYFAVTGQSLSDYSPAVEARDVSWLYEKVVRQNRQRKDQLTAPSVQSAGGETRIPSGQRHGFLLTHAGRLLQNGIGLEALESELQRINRELFVEPKPEDEIRKQAADFFKRWQVSPALLLMSQSNGAGAVDPANWRALFHTREEIENAPPLRFAIDDFLQEEGITLIGGLAGHGKTLCMLAMVRALLEGGKLFSKFQATRTAERVIYLIPEAGLGPFSFRLRLFRLMDYLGERLFVRTLSAKEPLLSLNDPRLLKAAEDSDIFLDTAVRFMEGNENDAGEQREFAQALFNLQGAGARTITGAHHSPKSFAKDTYMTLENVLRGSGDIGALAVTAWGVRQIDPEQNRIYVNNVKPRDFQPCAPFIIQGRPSLDQTGYFEMTEPPGYAGELADHLDKPRGGRPAIQEDKAAKAHQLHKEGKSQRAIADTLGVSVGTVNGWLKCSVQKPLNTF